MTLPQIVLITVPVLPAIAAVAITLARPAGRSSVTVVQGADGRALVGLHASRMGA